MKISVIVPTYNRPKALKLCLLSLAGQSMIPHEVLIADDGSAQETEDVVRQMQERLATVFPIRHVWHEDLGFRKPKILNETVRHASGDYLVFIDGDCMAHEQYVRSHIDKSSQDAILSGKRVEIGEKLTNRLLKEEIILNTFDRRLVLDALIGGKHKSRKVEEAIHLKSQLLRRLLHRDAITDDGVWGCNFSLYKSLFWDINGCDEDFADGSIEDNDLGIRALNQGKKVRSVRGLAIIFHLWHKSSWSVTSEKYQFNMSIIRRRIAQKETVCKNGIVKLL